MQVMSSGSPAIEKQNCKEGEITISDPTPPNALPPEPTIPPPPPLLPTLTSDPRRRRVRSFYWKPIPEERVQQHGAVNLWTLSRGAGRHTFHIDVRTVEELFGQRDESRSATKSSRRSRGHNATQEVKQETTILDSKRSMNVAIFLKRLKKSNQSIIEDIVCGKSEAFGSEPLRELLKLLPDPQEMDKLHAYRGDPAQLATVDSFMYQLTQLPKFNLRIEAMLLKEEFLPLCSSLKQDISIVRSAIRELLDCVELHSVLHLVLEAGNIMNAGGYGANAFGFRLSSLLSLADTKANKPGMNLLHFVALEAQKKDEQLLTFPEKIPHVERAARVSVETLDVELESLNKRVSNVEQNFHSDAQLLSQVQTFLQSAAGDLQAISNSRAGLQKEGYKLIDFFCEDFETFRLDECFHIFQHFCSRFRKAVQENVEREMRSETQLKRLREQEDKRRSWSAGEKVGGSFGSRSSSEIDMNSALKKEGLLGLLMSHSNAPHSPVARPSNLRRSRQRLSDDSPESVRSEIVSHTTEPQATTASHTHPNNVLEKIRVETHTLVPALQSFHFSPNVHHSNTPPQKTFCKESHEDKLSVTTLEKPSPPGLSDMVSKEEEKEKRDSAHITSEAVQDGQRTESKKENNFQVISIKQANDEEQPTSDTNTNLTKVINTHLKQSNDLTDAMPVLSALNEQAEFHTSTGQITESKSSNHGLVWDSEAPRNGITASNKSEEKKLSGLSDSEQDRSSFKTLRRTPSKILSSKVLASVSPQPASPFKVTPQHTVRTLTPSESQTMRKVISLGRHRHTGPLANSSDTQSLGVSSPATSRPSVHTHSPRAPVPVTTTMPRRHSHTLTPRAPTPATPMKARPHGHTLTSRASVPATTFAPSSGHSGANKAPYAASSLRRLSERKPVAKQKLVAEEKMCRSTLRAMAQAGGNPTLPNHQNPAHDHEPRFARNTVASTTRSAASMSKPSIRQSTATASLKEPLLNRTASLRLSQSRASPQSTISRTASARLLPSTGHNRQNISSFSEKPAASKDSLNKSARPAWR